MIAVRKLDERERASLRLSVPEPTDLGGAMCLSDTWLRPRDRIELANDLDYELLTYVVSGSLAHDAGSRTTALICAGEFQRAAVATTQEPAQSHVNPSLVEASHVVQIALCDPRLELTGRAQQRRFSLAQRRGRLCAVAMLDADASSLSVQSAIALYASMLEPGQHLVHAFTPGHSGLLHVVSGELEVAGNVLGPGDAAHARDERSLGFTARDLSEVLLIDLADMSSF